MLWVAVALAALVFLRPRTVAEVKADEYRARHAPDAAPAKPGVPNQSMVPESWVDACYHAGFSVGTVAGLLAQGLTGGLVKPDWVARAYGRMAVIWMLPASVALDNLTAALQSPDPIKTLTETYGSPQEQLADWWDKATAQYSDPPLPEWWPF